MRGTAATRMPGDVDVRDEGGSRRVTRLDPVAHTPAPFQHVEGFLAPSPRAPGIPSPSVSHMHESRLCSVGIDYGVADLPAAAQFWLPGARSRGESAGGKLRATRGSAGSTLVEVQRVSHPSRVHLDIETDDIEAEVQRLEALGHAAVEQIRTWWVMEAPTGQRFCVIRPQRGDLGEDANVWP
jgi:hypothetical protein